MKLYVCWGTYGPGWHACGKAHSALIEAGHDPKVEKVYGWAALPGLFNRGRGEVMELTGQKWVPVLMTDAGETVTSSDAIVEWARANPASGA